MEGREKEDDDDDHLFYGGLQEGYVPGRKSTLVDDFERLTFEIQLNQAILRRSYSSPMAGRQESMPPAQKPPPSRLARTLRKLLRPIYGVRLLRRKKPPAGGPPRGPHALRTFSRSCRV